MIGSPHIETASLWCRVTLQLNVIAENLSYKTNEAALSCVITRGPYWPGAGQES